MTHLLQNFPSSSPLLTLLTLLPYSTPLLLTLPPNTITHFHLSFLLTNLLPPLLLSSFLLTLLTSSLLYSYPPSFLLYLPPPSFIPILLLSYFTYLLPPLLLSSFLLSLLTSPLRYFYPPSSQKQSKAYFLLVLNLNIFFLISCLV